MDLHHFQNKRSKYGPKEQRKLAEAWKAVLVTSMALLPGFALDKLASGWVDMSPDSSLFWMSLAEELRD